MHTDPAPQLPRMLVLRIPEHTQTFLREVDKLDEFGIGIDLETAVAEVIELIQRQEDALYELTYSSYENYPLDETPLGHVLTAYLDAREQFARALLQQFQQYRVYLNGMLFYQLKHIDPTILILEKLEIPLTAHDRRIRNLDRQVSLAHRKRVQASEVSGTQLPQRPASAGEEV